MGFLDPPDFGVSLLPSEAFGLVTLHPLQVKLVSVEGL